MAFIAPLLVGTAGTAATTGVAATAATSGLIGTAGAVTAGGVASAAGVGMSALGSIRAGQAQAASAEYNAKLAQIEGASQAQAARRRGQQYMGAARAGIAKSGASFAGTPLLALAESASNAEIDALNAQWGAKMESNLYGAQAKSAKTAGYLGAGSSLLTGASKLY